jgi:S-adenosylmethionine synthetase
MLIQSSCETLVTTGQVILAGEVKSNTYLDVQQIARDVIKKLATRNQNICLKPMWYSFGYSRAISRLLIKG